MNLTDEQKLIINEIDKEDCQLLKINSVAGSGKTAMLIQIAEKLKPVSAMYLAYNKAIAVESQGKFPSSVRCMTTHSLAYQNTIKPYGLEIGFFNFKDIKEYIPYEFKILSIDIMNKFFLSKYTKFENFRKDTESQEPNVINAYDTAIKYIKKMFAGETNITHAGYLKFYHILLSSGKITPDNIDLLMLDEAGDLNAVTLEIFKLIPATKKIMVGDENQNIYTFNQTINCFEKMQDEGTQLEMTQSFRCESKIAEQIEAFGQEYINSTFKFKGIDKTLLDINDIKTTAYISRNNSQLVSKIIELNLTNTPFNLTRPAYSIFELVMILLNLDPNKRVTSPEWKHLNEDVDKFTNDYGLQKEFQTELKYILYMHDEDSAIKTAANLILNYGSNNIYNAYNSAKKYEKSKNHPYTVCTAHSSKGLQFDKVIVANDLNDSMSKTIERIEEGKDDEKDTDTILLYYVTISRSIKQIKNATHL